MDLKLVGGNIITLDGSDGATAVAVRADRIAAVGTDDEVRALDLGRCHTIDLGGKTLMPGFVDSHVHVFPTGLLEIAADLMDCKSTRDVCRAVGQKAAGAAPGQWVYGMRCSPWALHEGRFPTMAELDEVAPDNPVYIASGTLHSGAANTLGRRVIDEALGSRASDRLAPEQRGWFLDDKDHFPAFKVALDGLDDRTVTKLLRDVVEAATRKGVTTLHCLEGLLTTGDRDVALLQAIAPSLPVRVILMYQTMDVQRVLDLDLPRIGGCLTVDGACFEHTAYFYEPYLDRPETCGTLNLTEDEVRSFVFEAHEAGLQIGMHAIGDRAVDILVQAYVDAAEAHPRPDIRHRIEHFHTPTETAIAQAKRLKLALPMQPIFSYLWDRPTANHYETSFGSALAHRMEPFARLADEGLVVSGGSDSPVTPIDPLKGIQAAANNPRASRRTSVEVALRMFTTNGAWVAHDEADYGTITHGKVADLVVLGEDPYRCATEIDSLPVLLTMSRGEITHSAPGFAA